MKARRLIESSIYEPETLQTAFKAFDDAWAEIAHYFDGHADDAPRASCSRSSNRDAGRQRRSRAA